MRIDDATKVWVRIYLPSRATVMSITNIDGVELFLPTMRVIDDQHLLVDGYLPKKVYETLKKTYRIRILGNVQEEIAKASTYVSRTNRYRQS